MKTIISVLATLVIAGALSGCEQARIDAQMEALCKQDGGTNIYETVVLPKDQFTEYGDVKSFYDTMRLPKSKVTKDGSVSYLSEWTVAEQLRGGYKIIEKVEELRSIKPTLSKETYIVIRVSDNKTLGSHIYYQRIGGDILPRLGPDSAKDCPSDASEVVFFRRIFLKDN